MEISSYEDQRLPYVIQNCQPVQQAEIEIGLQDEKQRQRDRRVKFAKKLGGAALSVIALLSALGQAEAKYSEGHWLAHGAEVVPVPGTEAYATNGVENLVFMGFGEYDGTNAAREESQATGGKTLTAWVNNPSQSFTPCDDIAPVVENEIRENHIKELNLIGVSMGTGMALETMRCVVMYDKHNPRPSDGSGLTNEQLMPKVNYIVAYSSPAGMGNAIQGDLAHKVVTVAEDLGYEGDFAGKLAYSLAVQISQNPSLLTQPTSIPRIVLNGLEDANNGSPPKMDMSELEDLDNFSFQNNPEEYQDVVNPKNEPVSPVKFVYISSPTDGIVNDRSSERDFVDGFEKVGVTDVSSLETNEDHANTAASAQVFGQFMASESVKSILPKDNTPFISMITPPEG